MKPNTPNTWMSYVLWIVSIICFLSSVAFAECFEKSAFWRFEEPAAPFVDAVGALNGSCIDAASCPESVTGPFGSALQFYKNAGENGGSGLNVAASAQGDTIFDWSADDSFSIVFWMKRGNSEELTRNEVIIGRDNGDLLESEPDEMHWWIGVEAPQGTAYARFDVRPWSIANAGDRHARGKNNKFLIGTKVINDNTWHQIVFVRDAGKLENRLYVDGVLEAKTNVSYADTANYRAFASKAFPLNIGWMNLSQGYHYQGLFDELALYSLALPSWYVEYLFVSDERAEPCE